MTAPILPLLKAYTSPDPKAIIRDWLADIDFDRDTTVNHIYVLGRLSQRLGAGRGGLGDISPRIKGFARWLWAKQQTILGEWQNLHTLLEAHGIPSIWPGLLTVEQIRVSWEYGGPEILIHERDHAQSLEVLRRCGWQLRDYYTPPSRYPLIAGLRLWHKEKNHLELRWRLFRHDWSMEDEQIIWQWQQEKVLHPCHQTLWLAHQATSFPDAWFLFVADVLSMNLTEDDWRQIADQSREFHVAGRLADFVRAYGDLLPGSQIISENQLSIESPPEPYKPYNRRWVLRQLSIARQQHGLSYALNLLDQWVSFKTLPGRLRHRLLKKIAP